MFAIEKILLPIDFSERSADAADAASAVAEHFHSQITLLHVLGAGFDPLVISGQRATVHGFARADAEEKMQEFRCNEWHSLEVQRILREGDPASTIVEYAESEHIDLIMMPTHGYGPFRRMLLGSVTAKVLHDSRCPVWTSVHSEVKPAGVPVRPHRIACAIDLGMQSSNVLHWGNRLSREFGASLSLIHVAESLDPGTVDYYASPEWRHQFIGEARAELTGLLEAEGINAETRIEVGPAPDGVVERTRHFRADLLVIGRASHDGAGRLPTNAYAIIRDAPCPVLSV